MTKEEANGWRIQALQLAATMRAVHEQMPPQHLMAKTMKAQLDKFNTFFQPIAEREINGQQENSHGGSTGEADTAVQVSNRG